MNSIKPVLLLAVLAGIGYAVYARMNSPDPESTDNAPSWKGGLSVELPGEPGVAPPSDPAGGYSPAGAPADPSAPLANFPAPAAPAVASPAVPSSPLGAPSADYLPPGTRAAPDQQSVEASAPPAVSPQSISGDAAPWNGGRGNEPPVRDKTSAADVASAVPADGPRSANQFAPASATGEFAVALESIERDLEAGGDLWDNLQQLTLWHDDPRLTAEEQHRLSELLNQLAGTEIYSADHHRLHAPHEVQPGERLEDIGQAYSVPWQLLAKINGIDDPGALQPGEQLKVVRGPFAATISLDKRELILTLDGAYAGRFAIKLGRDFPAREGTYVVTDKIVNPPYHGPNRTIDGGDPANPLGVRWLGLGDNMGIHGSAEGASAEAVSSNAREVPGSIVLNPRDIDDVFDILDVGSKIVIRR